MAAAEGAGVTADEFVAFIAGLHGWFQLTGDDSLVRTRSFTKEQMIAVFEKLERVNKRNVQVLLLDLLQNDGQGFRWTKISRKGVITKDDIREWVLDNSVEFSAQHKMTKWWTYFAIVMRVFNEALGSARENLGFTAPGEQTGETSGGKREINVYLPSVRQALSNTILFSSLNAERITTLKFAFNLLYATITEIMTLLQRVNLGLGPSIKQNDGNVSSILPNGSVQAILRDAIRNSLLAPQVTAFYQRIKSVRAIATVPAPSTFVEAMDTTTKAETTDKRVLRADILIAQLTHYLNTHAFVHFTNHTQSIPDMQLAAYTEMTMKFNGFLGAKIGDMTSSLPLALLYLEYAITEDISFAVQLFGFINTDLAFHGKGELLHGDGPHSLATSEATVSWRSQLLAPLRNALSAYTDTARPDEMMDILGDFARTQIWHAVGGTQSSARQREDTAFLVLPEEVEKKWPKADGTANSAVIAELLHSTAQVILEPILRLQSVNVPMLARNPELVLQTCVAIVFQLSTFIVSVGQNMESGRIEGIDSSPITVVDATSALVVHFAQRTKNLNVNKDTTTFFTRLDFLVDTYPRGVRTQLNDLRSQDGSIAVVWRLGRLLLLYAFDFGSALEPFIVEALISYLRIFAQTVLHPVSPRVGVEGEGKEEELSEEERRAGASAALKNTFQVPTDDEHVQNEIFLIIQLLEGETLFPALLNRLGKNTIYRTALSVISDAEEAYTTLWETWQTFFVDIAASSTASATAARSQDAYARFPAWHRREYANLLSAASVLTDHVRALEDLLDNELAEGPRFMHMRALIILHKLEEAVQLYTSDFLHGNERSPGPAQCHTYIPLSPQHHRGESL